MKQPMLTGNESFAPVAPTMTRRSVLQQTGLGIGSLALSHLVQQDRARGAGSGSFDLQPKPGHFPAQAKSVIMLLMNGGPSQMDLFDPKPALNKYAGQKHPEDVESFQPGSEQDIVKGTTFKFQRYGQSGLDFSADLVPYLGSVADDVCQIRSMWSDNNNHPQGMRVLNTGKIFLGRPTLGSWVSYALGSENQNLPAYIVLRDPDGYNNGGTTIWTNGWLPAMYGGSEVQSKGAPVLNLKPAVKTPAGVQQANLSLLAALNQERRKRYPQDSRLEARIQHYELAARMQLAAEQTLDVSRETASTRALYGVDQPETDGFGRRCLMARRLVESGVRFILVTAPIQHGGMPWDHHGSLDRDIPKISRQVDKPSAGLIADLKQRGLLDETIVIWSGEFGRLPTGQRGTGRDHNRFAFTTLVAGGGFRGGYAHGATDPFGYKAVDDLVSCPDLHATLLHQLGLDHNALSFRHSGRDETLTDSPVTEARVVTELLAGPLRV